MAITNSFLDIEGKKINKADVVVVPFGFEATTTYGKGTKNGPSAIIKAYSQVEAFDEELWQTTDEKIEITILKKLYPKTFAEAKENIKKFIGKILSDKKFPIVLGGEHSITSFIVEEFKKYFNDFSILQFDAHADLRDSYLGKKFSHAAAMRRCLDLEGINLVQIGVRNFSTENDELNFWGKNQNRIKTFWAKDKKNWKIPEIVGVLKKNVYLTFDVDVFDPSIIPSTGTPEPGGLDWDDSLKILRAVCKNRNIIGADFVELAPIKNLHAPDFLVAKLIYKILGYIFNK